MESGNTEDQRLQPAHMMGMAQVEAIIQSSKEGNQQDIRDDNAPHPVPITGEQRKQEREEIRPKLACPLQGERVSVKYP